MTERVLTAVSRLTAWLRYYGQDKSPQFQDDLAIVLETAKAANRFCSPCPQCGGLVITLDAKTTLCGCPICGISLPEIPPAAVETNAP